MHRYTKPLMRFVASSTAKLKEWLAADLSGLDLLVIQIDGLYVSDHVVVAAIGIDGAGDLRIVHIAIIACGADTFYGHVNF